MTGPDPRIERDGAAQSGPRSHTPTSAIGAAECQDLMALDFKAQIFLAFAQIPSYSSRGC